MKMEHELKRVVAYYGEGLEVFGEPALSFAKNLRIGERCKINSLVYLNARSGITLGDDVTLSRGSKLISTGYDLDLFFNEGKRVHVTDKPIVIGNHCWICADAIILPGAEKTGEYVGSRFLANKDVPKNCLVAGVPAMMIIKEKVIWK